MPRIVRGGGLRGGGAALSRDFNPGALAITIEQLAAAQGAAIATTAQFRAQGRDVRYLRSIFVPGNAHCMCLFEAPDPDVVKAVNDTAQIPYTAVLEALDLPPQHA